MNNDNILSARGKLLEELLDPRVVACTEAILDLAGQRDWTNGFLIAVCTRTLMRTIGTQPGLSEVKLQSEIMVAASQLLIEYAYDNYRGTVDEAGVQSMGFSVPPGTEVTPELARQMVSDKLGVPVEDIELIDVHKLN